jgi:hypothetical protein
MKDKIKEACKTWKAHNLSGDQSILIHDLCERAWQACAEWMLSQVHEKFEDYEKEYWDTDLLCGKTSREWTDQNHVEMATSYQRRAWDAARLSSAKEIMEKDERIKKLESLILLTDYSVKDQQMNDVAIVQWQSYLLDFPELASKKEST